MIGYVTLGTNDLPRAVAFYDKLCAELGASRMIEMETGVLWAIDGVWPGLTLTKPFNKEPATVGNGVMVSFKAKDHEQVRRLYEIALANGGSDEGAPGPRVEGFYAAYFRDPDGNKLNAFVMD
ncbi:VOC family protein [Rhizorhapis suberifaciens]|uniref:Catechol 2,3-dioxygenase-like lactoylglutathione lyase family enzyme n=1 Tax=Rhizorhapis suberifaciens TaxID=13656 RepID=A0A840HV89_9SPHN|nr:VOC family protein [Rhizorhapis suberifaciens]MBB4642212.1 catechol 2,3-dioxygenase-like lactoylglutathione lyase family enzyme [Rhizorhapis suberifaciens]